MFVVPVSNSTNRLNIGTDTASNVVPVVKNCGWKPSGLPSEQKTSVPLDCAGDANIRTAAIAAATAPIRSWVFMGILSATWRRDTGSWTGGMVPQHAAKLNGSPRPADGGADQ